MERTEIIKALEHWAKNFDGKVKDLVTLCEAVNLIKELQAHNENLKKENKYLRESLVDEREHKEDMSVSELKAEIEILSKENETLKITTIDQYSHLCDCHDKIAEMLRQKEADTVKRMQERLKEHLEKPEFPWDSFTVAEEVIDQIAKEILEGKDGV